MCMEDIRIGREIAGEARVIAIPNGASTQIVAANTKRTRLIISADGVTKHTVGPSTITVAADAGLVLSTTNPVIQLTVENVGNLLFQSWNAFVTGATGTITVIDSSLERQK